MSVTRALKHTDKWNAVYKGIHYEISRRTLGKSGDHFMPEHSAWCYYLFLNADQVPEDLRPRFFLTPDLTAKPWAAFKWDQTAFYELETWHSGMTYYGTELHDGRIQIVKAGCDYDHLWDQEAGWPYSIERLDSDARRTIDELREKFPGLLGRCNYTGKWAVWSELFEWGDGYISADGILARDTAKAVPA